MSFGNTASKTIIKNFSGFSLQFKKLVLLALPILISQLAQVGIGVTDTIMSGHVSATDLAGVSVAGSIWISVYVFIVGLISATTSINARLHGAHLPKAIGRVVHNALWLGLFVGVLGALIVYNAQPFLALMEFEVEIQLISQGYLKAFAWGIPGLAFFQALRGFTEGIGRTIPIMAIGVITFLLNIPLNYIFIYGKLGVPALGGVGCGWASAVTMWVSFLLLLSYISCAKVYKSAEVFNDWRWPDWQGIREIVYLGVPIAVALAAEVSVFSLSSLLVASLGAVVVAGHQVALNFSSLLFMIPMSLSIALCIRVGHSLGAKEGKAAARNIAFTGVSIAIGFALINLSILMLWSSDIASLYSPDKAVQTVAVSLMFYAAIFQLSDGIQVCTAGALRGYKDTKVPMYITLFSYWLIGLPIGYVLGLTDLLVPALGAEGLWMGLVVGLTVAAVLLGVRLRHVAGVYQT